MRTLLLLEGSRDNALKIFLPYFEERGIQMNLSLLKQLLLNKFVNEAGIHNLSLRSNYYLVGVAKYYFNGDLTTNKDLAIGTEDKTDTFNDEVCKRLDALILILRDSYIDSVGTTFEQPEDFGTLTIQRLLRKYNKKINDALGIDTTSSKKSKKDTKQVSEDYSAGSNYDYEILYSYDDARKYEAPTHPGSWCITYGEQHYNGYVRRLGIHYVIFRKKGWENVPRQKGENWTSAKPQDEYGNSLIALLQSNTTGEPVYITSRWNHGSYVDDSHCEADHAYTKEEFLNVIGCGQDVLDRAFAQWKALRPIQKTGTNMSSVAKNKKIAIRKMKYAQMLINSGAKPEEVFNVFNKYNSTDDRHYDGYGYFNDIKNAGYAGVEVNDEMYYTFVCGKRVFFDKMFIPNYRLPWGGVRCIAKGGRIGEYVIFSGESQEKYMFDIKRRDFVTIDGTTKFKEIKTYDGEYAILVAANTQMSLLDLGTMKPIKAKNGSPWFESILGINSYRQSNVDSFNHRLYLPCVYEFNKKLKLIYDSASSEIYCFDLKTKKINQLPNLPGFELVNSNCRDSSMIEYRNNNEGVLSLYDLDNRQFVQYNGEKTFTCANINCISNGDFKYTIVFVKFKNGSVGFFHKETGEPIMFNGKPLDFGELDGCCGGYFMISVGRTENNIYKIMYYNPFSETFYHDDENGYVFERYSGIVVYRKNTPEDKKIGYGTLDIYKKKLPQADEQDNVVGLAESRIRKIATEELNEMVKRLTKKQRFFI